MLTSKELKELALDAGADVVGIAPIERFADFPAQENPLFAMPRAKSMIVMGHRVMRGTLRGAEEGTFLSHYAAMGCGYVNADIIPWTAREVSRQIENYGFEAMPVGNHFKWAAIEIPDRTLAEKAAHTVTQSVPVREGLPAPDIYINAVHAAYLAGLGEIGWSGVLISPVYGPRLRFGCVLTEMSFDEYDEVVAPGTLCSGCKRCAAECPGHAISADKSYTLSLGGYELHLGVRDEEACDTASVGAEKVPEGETGNYLDAIPKYKGQYRASPISPFRRKPSTVFGDGESVCAGLGCIRGCMVALEERGAMTNKFDSPFRRKPMWHVDWEKYRSGEKRQNDLPPNAVSAREKDKTTLSINE